MVCLTTSAVFLLPVVNAFPWVATQPGITLDLLDAGSRRRVERRQTSCPYNADHQGAVPINAQYPYLGAQGGKQGTGKGGIQVPAPGDVDHYFQPPGPNDIRGPCPGLNTAANHGFLSRDGITTYNELVDMQQNMYNVGFDLANLLAVAGVGLDGDIVNEKLSIGCDATSRTSSSDGLSGDELGLDGHNKFEGDTSLSRNDYFLADGDNHSFNGTLFQMMLETCNGNCSREALALYRYARYNQSLADNGDFFFGPGSLLLYGAASFLYELFPSFGINGTADEPTMMSFFGADKASDGTYVFNNAEQLPPNWFNRVESYNDGDVGQEIGRMYQLYPVAFGGNVGRNNFNAMNYSSYVQNGQLQTSDGPALVCLLYQIATAGAPSSVSAIQTLSGEASQWALGKLAPSIASFGCPENPNLGTQG